MRYGQSARARLVLTCIFVMLSGVSSADSLEEFADLQEIAEDHSISYKEAVPRIEALFARLDDPYTVNAVMLLSTEAAASAWTEMTRAAEGENGPSEEWYRFQEEFDRYDEAVFIGMCRLIQMGTSEAIEHLVDLTSHSLGPANKEILLQRITEVGEPALEHLRSKLEDTKRLEEGTGEGGEAQVEPDIQHWVVIKMLQDCIEFIQKGEILTVYVEPCPPSYEQ